MGAPPLTSDEEMMRVESVYVDDNTLIGGFRLILVTQAAGWERAIRVMHGNENWTEVKCGDKSGKVAKTDTGIKYSDMYVKYKGLPVRLELWKPGGLGVWDLQKSKTIELADFKTYDGKTLYYFWANHDDDRYFVPYYRKILADKLM